MEFKFGHLTSRLIQKSAISHDEESAEIASAISELNHDRAMIDRELNELKQAIGRYGYIAVHGTHGALEIARNTAKANDLLIVPDTPDSCMISAAGDYVMSKGGFSECNWTFFGIYRAMTQAAQDHINDTITANQKSRTKES